MGNSKKNCRKTTTEVGVRLRIDERRIKMNKDRDIPRNGDVWVCFEKGYKLYDRNRNAA